METTHKVLKEEFVGYLKSKINLQKGKLTMTDETISLSAHKTGLAAVGILEIFVKRMLEKKKTIFDLTFKNIQSVKQGKHGIETNVLEITDNSNVTYRIVVENYQDWEDAIREKSS